VKFVTGRIALAVRPVAGLSVVQGLIPPHPAALLAVQAYGADIGRTVAFGLIVGVPTTLVARPIFALLVHRHIKSWSRCETIISLLGLALTFALAAVV
jgi:H+/gluconate symporter-like permease